MFRIKQDNSVGGHSVKKLLMLACLVSASLLSMSHTGAQDQGKPGSKQVIKLKQDPTIRDCNEWLDEYEAFLNQICTNNEIRNSIKACFNLQWEGPMKAIHEYACTIFIDQQGNQSAPLYFLVEKKKLLAERQDVLNLIAKQRNEIRLGNLKSRLEALDEEIKLINDILGKMDSSCKDFENQKRQANMRSYGVEARCKLEFGRR